MLDAGTHHSHLLLKAWGEHSRVEFVFEVLELVADRSNLVSREQVWISALHSVGKHGFNICPTAGNRLGQKPGDDTKRKMKEAQRQRRAAEAAARPPKPYKDRYPGKPRKLSASDVENIIARLRGGERVLNIAKEFGAHRTTITKINLGTYFVKRQRSAGTTEPSAPIKLNARDGRNKESRMLAQKHNTQSDLFGSAVP